MNARAPLQVIDAGPVEQATFDGATVVLQKERLLLDDRLAMVRKYVTPGPKVVLVHGFAQNRYTWHSSRRSISAWLAAEGFDVYNLDLPGHGNSRIEGSGRFSDYVADLGRVADALGEPAFWVGHSLGGAAVYAGATLFPMRGVVGIGAVFRFAQTNRALNLLCQLSNRVQGRKVIGALNVRTRLAGRLLGKLFGITDIAGYAFPISGWAPGSIEAEVLAERLDRGFDWTSANVWFEMAKWGTTGRFEWEDAWTRTNVPVLVIAGDLDHLMVPEDARVACDLAGGPDRTFVLFDDYTTGHHWGHIDLITGKYAPRHTWALLRRWMADRVG